MTKPTPKPWRVVVATSDDFLAVYGPDCLLWTVKRDFGCLPCTWKRQKADARLVVRLRNSMKDKP